MPCSMVHNTQEDMKPLSAFIGYPPSNLLTINDMLPDRSRVVTSTASS